MYVNAEYLSDAATEEVRRFARVNPGCAAHIETRAKQARGSWPHRGPDRYVALQIVPQGAEPLRVLQQRTADRRGILLVYCGEGYYNRTGPRSAYGRAFEIAAQLQELVVATCCESEAVA